MIYVALIHPAIVEVYLQHIDDCDRVWFMECYMILVGSGSGSGLGLGLVDLNKKDVDIQNLNKNINENENL